VKPSCQFEHGAFPRTDCFFQASRDRWHGWGEESPFHRPNLGREYLMESARERAKETAVFGVILIAAAWPLVYMIITIWEVLHRHGLDQLP
jgi:hypothetical protein